MFATEVFSNPGFFVTYAAVQAALLLILVRLLDPFEKQPIWVLALMALWGATGAAFIALAGNEAVKGLLDANARDVFGDAIAAPLVEEAAKGLALLAALLLGRTVLTRAGVFGLDGVSALMVCGAAVGLGFGFTEDFFYFTDHSVNEGLAGGTDIFLGRRDFFGPTALHHPMFTAMFGAGLGLATWAVTTRGKALWGLAGFALAVLAHAINNGLIELILYFQYGLEETTAWVNDVSLNPSLDSTADTVSYVLGVFDWLLIIGFLVAVYLWQRYQRRVIAEQLEPEVETGVLSEEDRQQIITPLARTKLYWSLVREGRFDRYQQERDTHREAARLALLKWRTARFGGEEARIREQRRRVVAAASIAEYGGTLPRPSSRLIGREQELGDVTSLLSQPEQRLVTLTGPGGTGKTRLSLEIGAKLEKNFAGGAYFIDLAPISDPTRVPGEIAKGLEIAELAGENPLERLTAYLRDKHLLILLDNFEQVTAAGNDVATLMGSAPRVTFLVTSRIPLRIRGEREYAVPTLSIAAGADGATEAVQLFLDRAKTASPTFEPDSEELKAVENLCRRVDGLPLAIELLASRVSTLTPRALVRRIEAGEVGAGASPDVEAGAALTDAPVRHQTLDAAITWSTDLLDPDQMKIFQRLSVFPSGARPDAATAVCEDMDEARVLTLLGTLRDASLVVQRPDPNGEPRFRMLETIREFAANKLAQSGDEDRVKSLQADHCLSLARVGAQSFNTESSREWLPQLDLVYENLRAAMDWLVGHGRAGDAVEIASLLVPLWERGHMSEIRNWLEDAVLSGGQALEPLAEGQAQHLAGRLSLLLGDYDKAEKLLGAAIENPAISDDERMRTNWDAGWIQLFQGRYEEAKRLFENALETARKIGDRAAIGQSLGNLGRALSEMGEGQAARDALSESLEHRRAAGDRRGLASSLSNMAHAALRTQDPDAALESAEEALAVAEDIQDAPKTVEALYPLGIACIVRGDMGRAGEISVERLDRCNELGDKRGVAESLEILSVVEGRRGREERSAQLLGAGMAVRESIGANRWAAEQAGLDRHIPAIKEELGADKFASALAAGKAMTKDEAVAYALDSSDGAAPRAEPAPAATV